ncbi:hypothetical protein [Cytobacillus sp.]|uniref:hypothetical protein n=1 Tax=Cytobacillus sp. TaxID=2675269 RepID=UPI0035174074
MALTEKQLEIITRVVVDCLENEKKKQEKQRYDRRLRNVKLLLKNYRSFSEHTFDIQLEINELDRKLNLDELDTDEFAIESIKRSKERTLAMVRFINKMLNVYKLMSNQSQNPEHKRQCETIFDLYISDTKKTVKEIATCQKVDPRTVYRDIDKACETLSTLIFGVDSIKFY